MDMQTKDTYRSAEDWRDSQDDDAPVTSRTETVEYPGGVPPVDPNELRGEDGAGADSTETVVIDDPDLAAPAEPVPFPQLTAREREVGLLLAIGKKNSEIADELRVSVKTVDTHRGNLLHKLGCRNNVELCLMACRHGWVIP